MSGDENPAKALATPEAVIDQDVPGRLRDRLEDYLRAGRAEATWRAYDSDLRHFRRWCAQEGLVAAPATEQTIAAYLTDHAGVLATATLARRLAAISVLHQAMGVDPSPTSSARVRTVWAGIRRTHGVSPRKATAARTAELVRMLSSCGDRLIDHRDRLVLLLGFAGALRRGEVVRLDLEDVFEDEHGLRLRIRRSKTDQERAGALVGVPRGDNTETCPVTAWRRWLAESGITTGPVFRPVNRHGQLGCGRLSDRAVADIVRRRAETAGLVGEWSGHSLRAGFATEGYAQGTPELVIMRHGRWRSAAVMRGYVAEGGLWTDNAATRLGL